MSDEDENGGPARLNGNVNGNTIIVSPHAEPEELGIGDPNSPSRKAAKRTRQDTPGKALEERAQTAADSLPTPDTAKQTEQPLPLPDLRNLQEIAEASVRLGEVIDLTKDGTKDATSDLTNAVLDELKSARVQLKASTMTYIGHLIDTEMDLHDTRMRRAQITIARMKKKLDEMETALVAMAGMTDDDAVELSD